MLTMEPKREEKTNQKIMKITKDQEPFSGAKPNKPRVTVTIHTTNEIISKIEQKKLFHIEVGIKL